MIFFLLAAFFFAQQDQTPRPLLKVDPVYFDLAANTGGDLYLWAPGEFAASHLQVPLHHENVVLSYGSIESEKTFDIPVESGVKELTVFAAIERKDLAVLVRPDGTVAQDVQSFHHMLIASVKAPATGVWRLELHGAGKYAMTAHVNAADDGPRMGKIDASSCEVSVSGSVKDVQVMFVGRDGSLIRIAGSGDCTLPDLPFRVAIRGTDSNGAAFQRIESHLSKQTK